MQKILIVGRTPSRFTDLAREINNSGLAQADIVQYDNLGFLIDGGRTQIIDQITGKDIRDYQQVWVLSTSPRCTRDYIFSALVCYCRKYGVKIMDDNFTNFDGKLYEMWRYWEAGLRTPKTAFGSADFLAKVRPSFGGVAVLKSVNGAKGRDSFLIHSEEELREVLSNNQDVDFVLQDFIPNDGDYRVVLINFVPKVVIFRSANGKDFRNNTSLGSEATLIPLEQVPPGVLELAIAATKVAEVQLAGADIIVNKKTGKCSVLEINRTPQLASGTFVAEKTAALKELLQN